MTNTISETSLKPAEKTDNVALGRLLMLASSNLPIGSYTYSQGVEPAIEAGLITNEHSMLQFMEDYLHLAMVAYELPLLALMMQALRADNDPLYNDTLYNALADDYHASRESKEFVFESQQLALSLSAWLDEVLNLDVPSYVLKQGFLPLFATISAHWDLSSQQTLSTYAFGQIENMVLAAVKTVPLGQMAGQRIIWQLQQTLSEQVTHIVAQVESIDMADYLTDDALIDNVLIGHTLSSVGLSLDALFSRFNMSSNLPNLALLSCQHEQQYTRLFRS